MLDAFKAIVPSPSNVFYASQALLVRGTFPWLVSLSMEVLALGAPLSQPGAPASLLGCAPATRPQRAAGCSAFHTRSNPSKT